jgi:hypothetical protein
MASYDHLLSPEIPGIWLNHVFPEHGPDWLPSHRGGYTEEHRRQILETVHLFDTILDAIQRWVVHRTPDEDDEYGGMMEWRDFYGPRVSVQKIMESQFEPEISSRGRTQFRHILYSVVDTENTEGKLLLITLRSIRGEVSLIAAMERPYFFFRAMLTGIWETSSGMHIFLRTSDPDPQRDDIGWFHRHMRQYTVSLLDMLMENMRWWSNYIRNPPAPPAAPVESLEADWYPQLGGAKNI